MHLFGRLEDGRAFLARDRRLVPPSTSRRPPGLRCPDAARPVLEYLREVVADLRKGRFDDRLVYRKSLRKAPEAYTATTPPHVAAARKMAGKRGRVAYAMTIDGPEPAEDRRHPIDHEHYVDKQLRPVAEPVLALLGQDFADASGARKQLPLSEL